MGTHGCDGFTLNLSVQRNMLAALHMQCMHIFDTDAVPTLFDVPVDLQIATPKEHGPPKKRAKKRARSPEVS